MSIVVAYQFNMLTGIILTGGNSTRMGSDKSQLKVNNKTLSEIAFDKLNPFCDEICYSINKKQQYISYRNTVLDFYENEGPLSGIISALMYLETDILVLAVDLPKISTKTIEHLINNRNPNKLATVYFEEQKQQWEGMVSIWEYRSFPFLQTYFNNGGRSIQKFLFNHDVERVDLVNPEEFKNINTMDDFLDLR